ncbi:MAG: right-handed parallel beta-helix repeat-containing protein, partial [Anaerolineae bacterium]
MLRKATLALVVGLGLALGLLWLVDADLGARAAAPSWALAQGVSWADHAKHPAGELHVCLSGPPTCNYATVQEAVDNAEWGDVIKVAEGVYTDVHAREGITQVVFINKTVTIRGGYTTTNWSTPYAITQPTTLDAQGRGRVVYVTGFSAHAGLMDLRITGGDGTGLGGSYLGDAAGGIYVTDAATTISNCVIVANVGSTSGAAYGGGVYARYSQATLTGNIVEGNTASSADVGRAGGVYLNGCTATLGGNTVQSNTASTAANGNGGGIVVEHSTAELIDNTVVGNVATTGHIGGGGGIYAESSAVALRRNHLA